MDILEPFLKVFLLVFLAEFGDKSQLVCMTLSARYALMPVLIGSALAFSLLNLVAVLFGASIAEYLPSHIVFLIVGILFLFFGVQSLRAQDEEDATAPNLGRGVVVSVFLLIFFAELGDKTQLAVAAMAAVESVWIVWIAGTSALLMTSLLGIWFGRLLMQKISLKLIHRGAGALFIIFSLLSFRQLYAVLV